MPAKRIKVTLTEEALDLILFMIDGIRSKGMYNLTLEHYYFIGIIDYEMPIPEESRQKVVDYARVMSEIL